MATIQRFEDLEIWKKARQLNILVFRAIKKDGFSRDYKLVNQINGASGSVMDNIAEGFERGSRNEFVNFLSIAKGSAGEVKSQTYRAMDRNYILQNEFNEIYNLADQISKQTNKFIEYLNNSNFKGEKFKNRTANEPQEYYGFDIYDQLNNLPFD
ncbi:MAG: four helix bundle protein [Bacteroidia bacterium]